MNTVKEYFRNLLANLVIKLLYVVSVPDLVKHLKNREDALFTALLPLIPPEFRSVYNVEGDVFSKDSARGVAAFSTSYYLKSLVPPALRSTSGAFTSSHFGVAIRINRRIISGSLLEKLSIIPGVRDILDNPVGADLVVLSSSEHLEADLFKYIYLLLQDEDGVEVLTIKELLAPVTVYEG